MAGIQNIVSLDQLKPFLNKDGILEVALRDKKKKFTAFQKLVLNNSPEGEGKELLNKALNLMNKNNALSEKNLALLKNVTKLQQLNLVFSALNLCATCVGFAIMYAKLDKMSGQINQVMGTVKQGQDITVNYEFHKVLSEHSNMLDARKTQKYYTEEQMRQLVDAEYNVLNMLIEGFMKDHTDDKENLIISIMSMASMLAVSLRYFDELYYLNNKEAIGDGEIWHSSHDNWTGIFKKLESEEFIEKIQDHGVFDKGLTLFETDVYYLTILEQVKDMEESVEDNQQLVVELGSEELMAAFETYINQDVSEAIKEAFEQTEGALEDEEVVGAYQTAMKQMALAV
ncbi:MAG: hypothetical protein K5669_09525 [Lachnospiraceae bacterium]|nr:hypothetical protein [Lachnospiraceae bacterium]